MTREPTNRPIHPGQSLPRFTRRALGGASLALLLGADSLTKAEQSRENQAVKQGAEVAWLSSIQQPPSELPASAPKLYSLLSSQDGQAITTLDDWRPRQKQIRQWWRDFLKLPDAPRVLPPLTVLQEEQLDGVVRQRVAYRSEAGWPCEAYLLRPSGPARKRPGVVVFHSTVDHSILQPAGVAGRPEKAFGLKLAQLGYVTFCPRNYLWPANEKIDASGQAERYLAQHPESKGMAKMVMDGLIAVDLLASQEDVDPARLGAVGHSLGAKEVLYLAALDERIQVSVSSEGGIGSTFSNWDAAWYLGAAIRGPAFSREHHELLALSAPRPFLLLGGDSADGDHSWPFVREALPVYRLYGSPPRVGLLNHGQGHAVPPPAEKAIYEWFSTYLPL